MVALARKTRYRVFVEEQNVPEELEYDEFEDTSHKYLVFMGNEAVATCRWRFTEKGIKLERFAVLNEFRGRGLGALMVRHLLKEITRHGRELYLHAQVQVVDFYTKYGFVVDGPEFTEAGIRHHKMIFKG